MKFEATPPKAVLELCGEVVPMFLQKYDRLELTTNDAAFWWHFPSGNFCLMLSLKNHMLIVEDEQGKPKEFVRLLGVPEEIADAVNDLILDKMEDMEEDDVEG